MMITFAKRAVTTVWKPNGGKKLIRENGLTADRWGSEAAHYHKSDNL